MKSQEIGKIELKNEETTLFGSWKFQHWARKIVCHSSFLSLQLQTSHLINL